MAINSNSPRIGTATNLATGGTYDLLVVKYLDGFPEGRLSFGIHNTPMKVTGLQKVAQVFLKTLLSSTGSDPYYPSRGTEFLRLAKNSNLTGSDDQLLAEIQSAVADASSQTAASTRAFNIDASSQLSEVQILGLDTIQEGVTLYLRLRTVLGDEASLALPFPTFGVTE
jgi:hypothetical protein